LKSRLIRSLAILILAAFGAVSASAQGDGYPAPSPDPSRSQGSASVGVDVSPGVARISLTQGDVSTQRGDSGEWAAAVINAPIVSGDKVSTGDNARAELQLDFANMLRLGDRAQATIANITRNQIQVQIGEGIANYDVLRGSEADAEIDTPNVAIRPNRGGASLRVIVNSNDETEVIVRRGDAQISTQQGNTQVGQGQIITIHGTGDDTAYKVADAPPNDDWDSWIRERDNRIENAKSWNHTDRYYTGSEDLDAYGQWKTVPEYGQVWQPVQDPGWAPYRNGNWVWEPYYGWTWVPVEPWGWAPYHYGRWMYEDSAWVWWPGPVVGAPYYRPLWAPAYVSFFGFGGGVGVSVGFGFASFGWLPLGPGDYCHPWWGGYRDHYNVTNITNINNVNIYNNRGGSWNGLAPLRGNGYSNLRLAATNDHIRAGVSSVPAGNFGSGRVQARLVDSGTFRNGHVMTGNLPVVPSRQSLSASNRPASTSTIRGGQQHFFGSSAHTANVQSFDRQAAQVQQSIQHDNHFAPVRSGETLNARNGSAASFNKPSPAINSPSNQGGRVGTANPSNASPTNGWNRFGSQSQNRGNQSGTFQNRPQGTNQGSFGNNVPRPSQSSSQGSFGNNVPRPSQGSSQGSFGNNVPRPSQGSSQGSFGNNSTRSFPSSPNQGTRSAGSDQSGWRTFSNSGAQNGNNNYGSRNGPRPPTSTSPSGTLGNRPGSYGSPSTGTYSRGNSSSVARPPASYSGGNNGGDYRSFGSPSRGAAPAPSSRGGYSASPSNGGGSYPSSRSASPSYGGGSYPSSRSASPSNGGGSYPSSRSASPSYGGGSYPSSRGASPSYGGGSYPPSRSASPSYGGGSYPSSRSNGGGGYSSPSYPQSARGSYSRPPLDMRQPIVGGHSSGGYSAPSGGYHGSSGGGSSSHGSSGSSHGGGSPHSGGRGR